MALRHKLIKLIRVKNADDTSKHRFIAYFLINENIVKKYFGSSLGKAYIDHGDDDKRAAYLKRHVVREHWLNPTTPGSLSRYILWGESTSIAKNIDTFKTKFDL